MLRHPLAVLPFVLAPIAAQAPAAPAGVTWHDDFATARVLAQQTGKPLFVTFRCER